jgi:hypothetical protein
VLRRDRLQAYALTMFRITLLLNGAEQERIEQAAHNLWPEERLTHTETCRRLTLARIQMLGKVRPLDQAAALAKFKAETLKLRHSFAPMFTQLRACL